MLLSNATHGRGRRTYHFVHEVLNADFVQDTIGINEENEKVVVSLQVFGVDLVDEFEGGLLTVTLSAMREARDRDSRLAIGDIDALGIRVQRQWHA